jgi:hypothetical protein
MDCAQDTGGHDNWIIKRSTLDAGSGNAALQIKSDLGPIRNVTVDGNFLNGGNYVIFSRDGGNGTPQGIKITNNRFGRNFRYGILSKSGDITWSGNRWADTGEPIGLGDNPGGGVVLGDSTTPVEEGTRPCQSGVCDSVGLVDPGGRWRLLSALSANPSVDTFYYGNPADVAFMGDWNGDGVATPGLYRQSDGFVYLRHNNTQGVADVAFFFGDPGDIPLVGDFNGNGKDTVSIYRPSEGRVYVINHLGTDGGRLGAAQFSFYFGNPGDTPFVGDFNGDGIDTVGLHRASTGRVYFRNSLTQGNAHESFVYGNPGDVILAGDWDGDGDDTVAVYRRSTNRVYVNLENSAGVADYTLRVRSYPIAVRWGRD